MKYHFKRQSIVSNKEVNAFIQRHLGEDLKTIYKSLESDINRVFVFWGLLPVGGVLALMWIGPVILMVFDTIFGSSISIYITNIVEIYTIGIIMTSMIPIGIFILILITFFILLYVLHRKFNDVATTITNIQKEILPIGDILSKLQQIHGLIYICRKIRMLVSIFSRRKSDKLFSEYLYNINQEVLIGMKELSGKLSHSVQVHKENLLKARSEVENNITGTTELNSISELQKARLDKQIEQFEELQKILIKR